MVADQWHVSIYDAWWWISCWNLAGEEETFEKICFESLSDVEIFFMPYGVNVNMERSVRCGIDFMEWMSTGKGLSNVEIDFMVWKSTWKGLSDVEIDFTEWMSTWKPFQDVCVCIKQWEDLNAWMQIYIQCMQNSTQNLACRHHRLYHSASSIWPHGLSWLKTGGLAHVFQVEQWPGFLFLTRNTHLPLLLLFLVVLMISFGHWCYTQRFLLSSNLISMRCMLSERGKAQYFIKNWSVSTAFPPPAWYPLPTHPHPFLPRESYFTLHLFCSGRAARVHFTWTRPGEPATCCDTPTNTLMCAVTHGQTGGTSLCIALMHLLRQHLSLVCTASALKHPRTRLAGRLVCVDIIDNQ